MYRSTVVKRGQTLIDGVEGDGVEGDRPRVGVEGDRPRVGVEGDRPRVGAGANASIFFGGNRRNRARFHSS